MDDAAVRYARLRASDASRRHSAVEIERHAELRQPLDRFGRVFDDKFDRRRGCSARARDHRILDMALKRIAGFQHRRNPALRPRGRAVGKRAFGKHDHLSLWRQLQRRRQPRRTRTDDEDVGYSFPLRRCVRLQEHILQIGFLGRHIDDAKPSPCIAANTSPAFIRSLL